MYSNIRFPPYAGRPTCGDTLLLRLPLSGKLEKHYTIRANKRYLARAIAAKIAQITIAPDNLHGGEYLDEGGRAESCGRLVCALEGVSRLKAKPAFFCAVLLADSYYFNPEAEIFLIPSSQDCLLRSTL